jgi:succinate dehydrogenase/fumarate reductase flavoprotein subunit
VEDLDRLGPLRLDSGEVRAMYNGVMRSRDDAAKAQSDLILRELQAVMFAYNIGILKHADRLQEAQRLVSALGEQFKEIAAPHTHELVRLKETEAMLLAAQFILGASLFRTESRLSHFREDYAARDDANWLVWVDIVERGGKRELAKTPVPTPLCPVAPIARRPMRLSGHPAGLQDAPVAAI